MFLQDAAIHHHENSCLAGLLSSFLVDHVFLHPDGGNLESNGLIDDWLNEFGPPKDVDDIDLLGNI